MTHALFKQIDLTAKLGQDGSSLQALNALRVIRETVAKHLVGAEAAEEHPLERAVLALRTIAEYPCPEQDDLPAANMRQIALAALDGAGASSEPGNPGGEPVSGPGNAGEQAGADLERPEAWARLGAYWRNGFKHAEAQHKRVVEALRVDRDMWRDAAERGRSDVVAYIAERAKLLEEHDVALAEVELLRQFERICEGLPQDAIDGGWTVQGIRGYAKRLEDQLKTALGQHNVPSGWKLVPLEPTPEMLDARRDSEDGMDGYLVEDTEYYFPDRCAVRDFLACVYRGLLAAAPAPGGER
ncbi:TPA: hypothetical protein NIC38_001489 [Pseudomonas aeruginosa]|nr:hypothetical protein [Pseudomonas aeruginosa]HBP6556239.1 hypothetical protein [Pseudomonas aeruginosa]HCF2497303.1 hypothetical protein [Pseudomonas aeruginosa]HCF2904858.1 hypothetical protein [Pseudomonas aeruginosa]HEH6454752.1 hypothetical protein [Pseudomonas aeruginosa]